VRRFVKSYDIANCRCLTLACLSQNSERRDCNPGFLSLSLEIICDNQSFTCGKICNYLLYVGKPCKVDQRPKCVEISVKTKT
jgi:hypothetical protein